MLRDGRKSFVIKLSGVVRVFHSFVHFLRYSAKRSGKRWNGLVTHHVFRFAHYLGQVDVQRVWSRRATFWNVWHSWFQCILLVIRSYSWILVQYSAKVALKGLVKRFLKRIVINAGLSRSRDKWKSTGFSSCERRVIYRDCSRIKVAFFLYSDRRRYCILSYSCKDILRVYLWTMI